MKSTGIFCRPSCKSRIPNRNNVRIFHHAEQALSENFRPCKRCKPNGITLPNEEWVEQIKDYIEKHYDESLTLDMLAEMCHGSPFHLHGIELDVLAEKGMLSEPLQDIVKRDEGLYGIDEVIALSIVNVYGSIGFTNFGYIDKLKPGILEYLNDKSTGKVHTFLDDIVGGIAAAASSRLAHRAEHSE